MKKSILKVEEIVIDERLYPRVKPSDTTIRQYVKDMAKGDQFPPLYIGKFKGKNFLIDGRHRYEAYLLGGEKYVQCEIKDNFPTFNDMFLAAIRTNLKHGLQLGPKDRQKVAYTLRDMKFELEDISKMTGVKLKEFERKYVAKIKHVLIRDKVKNKEIPPMIRENISQKKQEQIQIVDEKELNAIEEDNKEEWMIDELTNMYEYFKSTRLIMRNKEIFNLVRNIKKVLKKKYPKC